jgi:hypothetical protein
MKHTQRDTLNGRTNNCWCLRHAVKTCFRELTTSPWLPRVPSQLSASFHDAPTQRLTNLPQPPTHLPVMSTQKLAQP